MTREEAIRWLEDIHRRFNPTGENLENEGGDVHLQAIDMAIEALSAEAVQRWIPVSERLPERGKDVLVTRKYYGKDDCNKDAIYVEISACYADGEEWHGYSDEYKMNPRNHKVVAWMPLPEPYKGGGTE